MVQIRLSRDLEASARSAPTPMTVDELLARFPEVPRDLSDEPILAEYVKAFGTAGTRNFAQPGRVARLLVDQTSSQMTI